VADVEAPVPMEEIPEADDPMSALMALARQQQAQRDEALARLRGLSRQQGAQAQGLRTMSLLTSMGQNPLLQGLQREAGQQGSQLQGMAMQAESRADAAERGIDPIGIARLQHLAANQKAQQDLAAERMKQQKEIADAKAEAAQNKAAAGAAGAAKKRADKLAELERKIVGDTRKEFEGLGPVKEYRMADIAYKRVGNAVKTAIETPGGSPASQIAAVYAVMKTFDPSTGVKEGEYATAEKAGAKIPDWLLRQYNKVVTGEFLTPRQLNDFERAAKTQFDAYRDAYEQQAIRYAALVPEGSAEKVIGEPVPTRKPAPAAPRATATQAMPQGPDGALTLEDVPAPEELVPMISPKGVRKMVPRSRVQDAIKAGGRLADG
jgi:hypothetical protein